MGRWGGRDSDTAGMRDRGGFRMLLCVSVTFEN